MEYEMSMRQAVDADVARLRKLLDDTNVMRLHLESDIESLKEELINLRKNHELVRTLIKRYMALQRIRIYNSVPRHYDNPFFNLLAQDPTDLVQEITP